MLLSEIVSLINGQWNGLSDFEIHCIKTLDEACTEDLTFLFDKKKLSVAKQSKAKAIISYCALPQHINHVIVKDPRKCLPIILEQFKEEKPRPFISEQIVCPSSVKIGKNVTIAAFCNIGEAVVIGNNTTIHANVTLYPGVKIGSNTIIHAGTVIGSDGFGYVPDGKKWKKIPHIGSVVIGDNVEIGANVCIDRGCLGNTVIKNGTKIDNLVHIAHNTQIGQNCAVTSLVGFAGSVILGDQVMVGGQSGFAEKTQVGDQVVVMARSGVTKNIPSGSIVSGFPARDHRLELRRQAALLKKINEVKNESD